GDREGHVEYLGEGLRQQGLTRAGRPQQQDVALLQLDVVAFQARDDALVVVVHRHGEHFLGAVLADDVLVEELGDALGLGYLATEAEVQARSEEHTSELQSRGHLVCRLLLEKKKKKHKRRNIDIKKQSSPCTSTRPHRVS